MTSGQAGPLLVGLRKAFSMGATAGLAPSGAPQSLENLEREILLEIAQMVPDFEPETMVLSSRFNEDWKLIPHSAVEIRTKGMSVGGTKLYCEIRPARPDTFGSAGD